MATQDNTSKFSKEPIGEILIKRGLINEKQLQEALEAQKNQKGFVGDILVKLGYVEEIDIVVALIIQCNFPYIAINKYELDKKVLALIPKDIAREFEVIPIDQVGHVLSVVMADPLNETIKEKIEKITGCKIAPFIGTKSEIDMAINKWYGTP